MRYLLVIVMLFLSAQAMSATATVRQGVTVNQFAIDDPGNASGFDNIRVFTSWKTAEVVIQVSGANTHTSSESFYCWEDVDETLCPDDDIGGGELRSPVLVFLDAIMASNNLIIGADLSDAEQRMIYLAFWHEYRMKKLVTDVLAEMDVEGLNNTQKRRGLKFVYFGNGIDIATAQSLANDRVTNSIVATYDEYGLTNIPLQDRRILKLFGEAAWFISEE